MKKCLVRTISVFFVFFCIKICYNTYQLQPLSYKIIIEVDALNTYIIIFSRKNYVAYNFSLRYDCLLYVCHHDQKNVTADIAYYDSICIKDMAGVLTPQTGYELVKGIKENVSIPLEVHTHATSGIAEMTYLKVAEAGADIIDTAVSSFAGGTSLPATESMAIALP